MRRVLFPLLLAAGLVGAPAFAAEIQDPGGMPTSQSNSASSAAPSLEGALLLLRTEKYESAAEEYNSLIAAGTQPALAYAGLARAYLRLGKIAEANAAAAKAIEISPTLADAHAALGEVYFRQAKLPEAEQEFIALIRAGTANARGYLGMARISAANSYYAQAKKMIDHAYLLDPADPDVSVERFRIYSSQGRFHVGTVIITRETKSDDTEPGRTEAAIVVPADTSDPSKRPCRMVSHTNTMQT